MPLRTPLYEHLQETVIRAGDLAGELFRKDIHIETKPDGSKVSEADYAVNEFLQQKLCAFDPSYSWLSEESPVTDERLDAKRTWIIDPIDGTHSFLKGDTDWTIVAALIEKGEPVLGAVYNPVLNELYMAEKGSGAQLNGIDISTNSSEHVKNAHIIASKAQFDRVFPDETTAPKRSWRCSMAYRIALVAAGKADATISMTPKNDWDIAAAHIILEEAGGQMTTQKGVKLRYNKPKLKHSGVVASSTPLYKNLIQITTAAADKPRKAQ
ncbi:MAG: 3'(2'),5'-bisphosphate nucleotidase CysQ [Rhodomicrobium sp.]|nr:MAG: 3'(2'),5'-bisphosphate nucleotidase CysQ [Rhodomicrobium sp.]